MKVAPLAAARAMTDLHIFRFQATLFREQIWPTAARTIVRILVRRYKRDKRCEKAAEDKQSIMLGHRENRHLNRDDVARIVAARQARQIR